MATKRKSTQGPIDWHPSELVPDGSKEGYAIKQLTPKRDPQTGRLVFEMHGYTLTPRSTDGYHITATLELDDERGAAVTHLVIESSPFVERDDDGYRVRQPDERILSPINATTLGHIRFTDLVNRVAEIEEGYAQAIAAELPEAGQAARQSATNLKKRGRRKDPAKDARYAEQVLTSMREGRGYQARLMYLDDDWMLSREGVKKRVSRLRDSGWLHPGYGMPGPTLVSWRKNHSKDEEDLHGED